MTQASMIKGTLDLTILEAENLKKKDFNKMDPYCVIEFKDHTFKTEVCKKGHQNPTWNQTLKIPIEGVSLNDTICFKVMDKELISDNKIGKAVITFQQLANICKSEKECHIDLETFGLLDKDKPAGRLKIRPCFSGSGWPGCDKSLAKDEQKLENKSLEPLPQHGGSVPEGGKHPPSEGVKPYEGQPTGYYQHPNRDAPDRTDQPLSPSHQKVERVADQFADLYTKANREKLCPEGQQQQGQCPEGQERYGMSGQKDDVGSQGQPIYGMSGQKDDVGSQGQERYGMSGQKDDVGSQGQPIGTVGTQDIGSHEQVKGSQEQPVRQKGDMGVKESEVFPPPPGREHAYQRTTDV